MRFAFIKEYKKTWPVAVTCQVLCVSRSGFYAWTRREESDRMKRNKELTSKIQIVHEQSRRTYGSPRVTVDLQEQGVSVCRNTVARLMKEAEIRAQSRRRFVPRTTDSAHEHPIPPNRLDRDFAAQAPNEKWACDITYLPTDQGWLYLAVVLDLYSRKVVGWSMQEHMKAELVQEALTMAVSARRPQAGLLHHSDRGVQYACGDYQILLQKHGISCSMSRKGNCYDNAVVESFFGKLKTELVYGQRWSNANQARSAVFSYIEVFYNRQRRHSSLDYLSPEAFEARLN